MRDARGADVCGTKLASGFHEARRCQHLGYFLVCGEDTWQRLDFGLLGPGLERPMHRWFCRPTPVAPLGASLAALWTSRTWNQCLQVGEVRPLCPGLCPGLCPPLFHSSLFRRTAGRSRVSRRGSLVRGAWCIEGRVR
jgi:hypothetical protein